MSVDENSLLLMAIAAGGAFVLNSLQKPGKRQEQLVILAVTGLAAYAMRQFEGRGEQAGQQSNTLAAVGEQVRTLFETARRHDARLNEHDEDMNNLRVEVRAVTTSVADLVKRMDKWFEAPPSRRGRN